MQILLFMFHVGCSTQKSIEESEKNTEEMQRVEKTKSAEKESNVVSRNKNSTAKVKHIAVPELYQISNNKSEHPPVIIDVRSESEFQRGHIPTAIHIPLQEISKKGKDIEGLLKGQDSAFYLVCAVGRRSAQAAEELLSMGFEKPINVMGGTNGWMALGFPTEKGTLSPSQEATQTD